MTRLVRRKKTKKFSFLDLTPEQVEYIKREFPQAITPPESRSYGFPQYLDRRNELVFDKEINRYKGVPQFLPTTWSAYVDKTCTPQEMIEGANRYIREKYGPNSQYWLDSTREPHSVTPGDVEEVIRAVERSSLAFEEYAAGHPSGVTEGGDARADADRGDVVGDRPGDGQPDGDPEGTAPQES